MSLTQAQKEYMTRKSPILWLEEYQIKNERGERIDFYNHLFQYDILRDFTPEQCGQKPAQVGWTTLMTLKIIWACKNLGLDIIYTLPTDDDVSQFVGGKVNRIIQNNPILQEYTKDKDSVEQKQFGANMIYLRGTWTKGKATQVSADWLIHDEVDSSKQEVLNDFDSRTKHSKFKWRSWFSHPSVPGFGVNKVFIKSDQKHWFQKCSRCNYEWYLKWPDNVDLERGIYICVQCKQEFKEEDRRKGRWVKKKMDSEISGYQISSLMCPWTPAKEIITKFRDNSEEYFFTKVLGLPYVGKGNVVTEHMILKNCIEEENSKTGRIIIGCDTGLTQYYVVGNKEGIFHYGKSDGYEEIEKILQKNSNAILVMDAKGDLTEPRRLQQKYLGRVFLCDYRLDRKTLQLVSWGTEKEEGNVIIDRNRMIQLLVEEFDKEMITLNGKKAEWYDYYLHWKSLFRVEEEDSLGIPRRIWKRNGADHWAHATVYYRTGMSRFADEGFVQSANDFSDVFQAQQAYQDFGGKTLLITNKKKREDWRIT